MNTNLTKEPAQEVKSLNKVIEINEAKIQSQLDTMVCDTVQQTLNALLGAEADQLCNAKRYERTEGRTDQRAWHLEFAKQAGRVNLQ